MIQIKKVLKVRKRGLKRQLEAKRSKMKKAMWSGIESH